MTDFDIEQFLRERHPGMTIDRPALHIERDRMDAFLATISGQGYRESLGMLTLGLSLVYRGALNNDRTILEFCDIAVANIKGFIDRPPPGFGAVNLSQDDCECPICVARRAATAKRAKRQTKARAKTRAE